MIINSNPAVFSFQSEINASRFVVWICDGIPGSRFCNRDYDFGAINLGSGSGSGFEVQTDSISYAAEQKLDFWAPNGKNTRSRTKSMPKIYFDQRNSGAQHEIKRENWIWTRKLDLNSPTESRFQRKNQISMAKSPKTEPDIAAPTLIAEKTAPNIEIGVKLSA